ncbi:CRISPR-associated protein Cas5, Dvulg subtype [Neisseria polysaccharea ATCC 43768]|nr:CRISPR-associated protein Cas5, Dvulg subtype [Neisseria polysaccharea ATCC 43768]
MSFILEISGDLACFTRPELKVERVSYPVITPSAARNILMAILWKPAIRWRVLKIEILKPIQWTNIRRNEVGTKMSERSTSLYIEDNRQQRASMMLKDVAYRIHADFDMTSEAGESDNYVKFAEMFKRRAKKGNISTSLIWVAASFPAISGYLKSLKTVCHAKTLPKISVLCCTTWISANPIRAIPIMLSQCFTNAKR